MSAVLRKKISAAGGFPPKIVQCAPFWGALDIACKKWSKAIYGGELAGQVTGQVITNWTSAQHSMAERYAFAPLTKPEGVLLAVAIDRAAAARYAALRLHQPTESLIEAADLFLKLMSEHPAQSLWGTLEEACLEGRDKDDPIVLGDPASLADNLDPALRVARITIAFAAEGGEDGWLLEGGEEPPEIQIYCDLLKLEQLTAEYRRRAIARQAKAGETDKTELRTRLRQSSLKLEAVLDNITLSVGECSRLKVGDVLELPNVQDGELMLCAEMMSSQAEIARGRMGTWKGHRALKLNGPVFESFAREIAGI